VPNQPEHIGEKSLVLSGTIFTSLSTLNEVQEANPGRYFAFIKASAGVRFYTVINHVSFCILLGCFADIHRNHLDGTQFIPVIWNSVIREAALAASGPWTEK
jgi:hypothetical protein